MPMMGDFNATLSPGDSIHHTNTPNVCPPSKNSPFFKKFLNSYRLTSLIPHFIDPSPSRFTDTIIDIEGSDKDIMSDHATIIFLICSQKLKPHPKKSTE